MLEEIFRLIHLINKWHKEFSTQFYSNHTNKAYNLKNTRVDTIFYEDYTYDESFISLLRNYIESISILSIAFNFTSQNDEIETRSRVKNIESTLNKLYYYRFGRVDCTFPIQKCLNDILGFRLLLNSSDIEYDKLLEEITSSNTINQILFRSYVRKDKDYLGLHLYFKNNNNQFFPWELQVWKKEDEQSNELSHRNHKEKRDYIEWSKLYKKNSTREEDKTHDTPPNSNRKLL